MFDGMGVNFAPTAENAMDAPRQGQLEGLPAAIKILSLRMPKFLGARGLAPGALMDGMGGGRGMDPFASSVMEAMMASLMGGSGQADVNIIPGVGPGGGQPTLGTAPEAPVTPPEPPMQRNREAFPNPNRNRGYGGANPY